MPKCLLLTTPQTASSHYRAPEQLAMELEYSAKVYVMSRTPVRTFVELVTCFMTSPPALQGFQGLAFHQPLELPTWEAPEYAHTLRHVERFLIDQQAISTLFIRFDSRETSRFSWLLVTATVRRLRGVYKAIAHVGHYQTPHCRYPPP